MEEIDLCWRLQKLGYSIKCFPQSTVHHVGGGVLDYNHPNKTYLNFRNNLIMCFKNWSWGQIFWKLPLRFALDAIAAWRFLFQGKPKAFAAIAKAHLHFMLGFFKWRKQSVKGKHKPKGIVGKSIVFKYFLKNKKTFKSIVE